MKKKNERCPNRLKRLVRFFVWAFTGTIALVMCAGFVKACLDLVVLTKRNPMASLQALAFLSVVGLVVLGVVKGAQWAFKD